MEKVSFVENAITSEVALREIVGTPHELVKNKSISFIDETAKKYISMSPLMFLSTSDADGNCDVSPRGDEPGSIHVLNKEQLVIPDRPGNRRVDSIINIISNPHVGLIFLIPGLEEVLRINGRAYIIQNNDILSKMSVDSKNPLLGIGVEVEECFIHCPRALKKSMVWDIDKWPNKENIPSMMEIFQAHLKINGMELKE
ncbi:MSMEG_1061 family FMN-dependent PPOX-type flavoprotein [Bacillus sp. FJAT-45350]|uniref:MSMEG_1061 family FMN-dependent PPOX-type flavoprotein n=1 Tax=Bacillus sp. FJAT-45350 TaxID=2011014 RepID=UPI00211CB78E|nr:MSMEG_1061 family FMN-dependent PPOX-type flavoprotein [Bacillus sp. FJAT-45350]